MEMFLAALFSYAVGALIYRHLYRVRLARMIAAHQAVMDRFYSDIDDELRRCSYMPFVSDEKVQSIFDNAPQKSVEFKVARAAMARRGLSYVKEA